MGSPVLLMTRPESSARRFVARIASALLHDITVVYAPLIKIVRTAKPPVISRGTDVIFTSVNGVLFAPDGAGRGCFCVGEATASAARARGWFILHVAQTAEELVQYLRDSSQRTPLLHLSGVHRRGDIASRLSAAGRPTAVIALYDQQQCPFTSETKKLFAEAQQVIAPVFSPRTAELLLQSGVTLSTTSVVAISAAVADVFDENAPQKLLVAQAPNGREVRRCVEMLLRGTS
ncbi:MAG: uroporphyrinogen-III synthase [Pseudomonadota bacterium]